MLSCEIRYHVKFILFWSSRIPKIWVTVIHKVGTYTVHCLHDGKLTIAVLTTRLWHSAGVGAWSTNAS